jgi:hypothetical protein
MRSVRVVAAVFAVAITMLVGSIGVATADEHSHRVQDRVLAAEVCEPMVRDAVVAAAQQSLVRTQKGRWQGSRYTCRYDLGEFGVLLARVRVYDDEAAAVHAFAVRRSRTTRPSTLYGIGTGAFEARDGSLLVAKKDNFVLTVDGRALSSTVRPDGVVFSATRAVFDCW